MKAMVYRGPFKVRVEEKPDPKICAGPDLLG